MGEAAVPVTEPALGVDELAARAVALIAAGNDLIRADIARGGAWNPGWAIWARHAAGLEKAMGEASMWRAIGEEVPVAAAQPARHRHRIPRQRSQSQFWPRIVRGFVPVGALGAILKRAWKPALRQHALKAVAWAAHPAHMLGVTAAVAAPVVLVTAAVVTLGHPAVQSRTDAAGAIPAPAASLWTAVPIVPPSPGAPVTVHPAADARGAGELPAGVPAPWFAAPSSASPSAAVTPSPSAGVLSVNAYEVDLGQGDGTDPLQGTVTVTAQGGQVSFGAVSGSDEEVTVSPAEGILAAGQSAVLTFTISPEAQVTGGSATVRVWGGSAAAIAIAVTWQAAPVLSPSASPSPAATDMDPPAGPSPTPDPGSS
jgi:hypothetical protein